jgi:acyl carrier protein
MSDIALKLNKVLVDEFEIDEELIHPEANLRETLDLDSLDYVDLVIAIESVSGVKLGESDFKGIVNFQDLYNTLEAKI